VQTHLVSCLPDADAPATSRIKASFGTSARGDHHQHGAAAAAAALGINFSTCIHREGVEEPASSFIFRSLETGSRTIVNYNGLEEMTLEEFKDVAMRFKREDESWWHFEVLRHHQTPPSFITSTHPLALHV
jgi:ketohexokinase